MRYQFAERSFLHRVELCGQACPVFASAVSQPLFSRKVWNQVYVLLFVPVIDSHMFLCRQPFFSTMCSPPFKRR